MIQIIGEFSSLHQLRFGPLPLKIKAKVWRHFGVLLRRLETGTPEIREKEQMNMKKFLAIFLLPAVLVTSLAKAQDPALPASPSATQSPAAMNAASPPANQQNMDKMATTVTRAAEMCETMMKKEMAGAPYKMAAGIAIGALLLIALILFVILEVQWIIYWSRLLKIQKRGDRV